MSDAGSAFRDLRDSVGLSYDARSVHADLEEVQHRVRRARAWRAVLSTGVGLLVVVGGTVVATQLVGGGNVAPAQTPSSSPSATGEPHVTGDSVPAWCNSATVVAGKPFGNLGGFEGWFNSTEDAPCDEWDQQVKDHPDTVWVNTIDNTMLEAYYRTSRDALGVYATLTGDFTIPQPDPMWPEDSLVLIDPQTGEVLVVEDPANYAGTATD